MSKLFHSALAVSPLFACPAILRNIDRQYNANTLTNLIPSLYAGVDIVSRELVGAIPSVFRNVNGERAALGQAITYSVAPAATSSNNTPSMTVPTPADQTIGNGSMSITKAKYHAFAVNGEEVKGLNSGVGYSVIQADQFAQGVRVLVNEVETDICTEANINGSRAFGTAGTTPFASDLSDAANIRKILDDNGAPQTGRSAVIDTSAGAKMRTLGQLTKANEAGGTMTLRDGELLNLHGISFKESNAVKQHVKGTGAGATTNTAGYAVGATVITLASAGTGTIVAGDVITFAGDTNKYVVASGDADVSNGGTITLAAPGLRVAIPTAATAITVLANHSSNFAFSQNAIHLIARAPALPPEGDIALDRTQIVDGRSGLVFEVAVYGGFQMIGYFVFLSWGVKAVKPEHIALLLG